MKLIKKDYGKVLQKIGIGKQVKGIATSINSDPPYGRRTSGKPAFTIREISVKYAEQGKNQRYE